MNTYIIYIYIYMYIYIYIYEFILYIIFLCCIHIIILIILINECFEVDWGQFLGPAGDGFRDGQRVFQISDTVI